MYLLLPLILWVTDVLTRRVAFVNVIAFLLILIFIFGGKYYNGWDWVNYNPYFACVPAFNSTWEPCLDRPQWEIGYDLLNRLIKTFSYNVQILYIVIAIFQIFALYIFSRRFGYRFAVLSSIWVLTLGWGLWMQVLRQGLAVSFLLLAAVLYSNGKARWAVLLAGLGILFHYSAVIPLFIALIVLVRRIHYKILIGFLMGSVLYVFVFLAPDYVSGKTEIYSGTAELNFFRILRYSLYIPMFYIIYMNREKLKGVFGVRLFNVGRMLIIFMIILIPLSSLTWTSRLIIYGIIPLVLGGAFIMSQIKLNVVKRIVVVLPLLILYSYTFLEPLNRIDVQPLDNYFVRLIKNEDISFSEASAKLRERLCAIDRC